MHKVKEYVKSWGFASAVLAALSVALSVTIMVLASVVASDAVRKAALLSVCTTTGSCQIRLWIPIVAGALNTLLALIAVTIFFAVVRKKAAAASAAQKTGDHKKCAEELGSSKSWQLAVFFMMLIVALVFATVTIFSLVWYIETPPTMETVPTLPAGVYAVFSGDVNEKLALENFIISLVGGALALASAIIAFYYRSNLIKMCKPMGVSDPLLGGQAQFSGSSYTIDGQNLQLTSPQVYARNGFSAQP
jgi:hypothetical protein